MWEQTVCQLLSSPNIYQSPFVPLRSGSGHATPGGPEGRLRSECSGAQETVLLCFSWEQNPLLFLQKQASKPTSFSFLIQGEFFQTRPQKGLPHVPLVP